MAPPPKPPVICYDLYSNMPKVKKRQIDSGMDVRLHQSMGRQIDSGMDVRLHQSMRRQIDMLTAKLDSVKRAQIHMARQYGLSHNAAKYMQEKEEEIAKLRKQIEEFSEMRQRDALKHAQQIKELMMKQNELQCKRPVSGAIRSSTPNSLSSPAHSTSSSSANTGSQPTTNSQGSTTSSTISLSSCSSASSISPCAGRTRSENKNLSRVDRSTPRNDHFVKTPQLARRANRHVTINATPFKTPPSHIQTPPSLFFHTAPLDDDTLEVTDIKFFDKVEDKTMMEMNGLMHRVKSTLKEIQRL